jgi:hypothetical protein
MNQSLRQPGPGRSARLTGPARIIAHYECIPDYTRTGGYGSKEERQIEAIYRSRSGQDDGAGADWNAADVTGGPRPQKKEGKYGEAQADVGEVVRRRYPLSCSVKDRRNRKVVRQVAYGTNLPGSLAAHPPTERRPCVRNCCQRNRRAAKKGCAAHGRAGDARRRTADRSASAARERHCERWP